MVYQTQIVIWNKMHSLDFFQVPRNMFYGMCG